MRPSRRKTDGITRRHSRPVLSRSSRTAQFGIHDITIEQGGEKLLENKPELQLYKTLDTKIVQYN